MDTEKLLEATIFQYMDLRELRLSEETYKCLNYWGCDTIGCLINMTESQVQRIRGMDNEKFTEIVRHLSFMGLVLESDDPDYPLQSRENVKKYPYPANLFAAMNEIVPCITIADKYEDHIKIGLATALSALSDQEEMLIVLRYKYGESFSALGRTYNISHNAARYKIKNAIQKLMQPPYRNMIQHGIDGYVEQQAEERAKEKVKEMLLEEYQRGYTDGMAAQKQKSTIDESQRIDLSSINPSVLSLTIDELNLSVHSSYCLRRAGIYTVADMVNCDSERIRKIRNLGVKSATELWKKLAELGIPNSCWDPNKVFG